MRHEYFADEAEAIKCHKEHLEAGHSAELISRSRAGNVIHCVRSEEPKVQPSDGE